MNYFKFYRSYLVAVFILTFFSSCYSYDAKRYSCIIFMILSFLGMKGQELSPSKMDVVIRLGIETDDLNENDIHLDNKLREIVFVERRRKRNKTVAYVLTGVGALTITSGILIFSQKENEEMSSNGFSRTIGGLTTALGVTEIGVSVPLFIASSKRKKERDKLIQKIKTQKGLNPNF